MAALLIVLKIIVAIFVILGAIAFVKKPSSVYGNQPEEKNPMEGKKVLLVKDGSDVKNADGVRGHLEPIGSSGKRKGFYEHIIKRLLDIVLSFGGLLVLPPMFLVLSIWILIDDPGSILFTQKRVGENKRYFKLHKFCSMRLSTPHNVPTHMLSNPGQYITRSGKFMRNHSLGELPQIWDIFMGNMSVIGERGIIEATKKNMAFSRVVAVNSDSL